MKHWIFFFLSGLLMVAHATGAPQEKQWDVRLEEPTGLYPRDGEIVRIPVESLGGNRSGFLVVSPEGNEVPWQVAGPDLLFPAEVVPGELPVYRIRCCQSAPREPFLSQVQVRKVGMRRIEMSNSRFRVMVDYSIPAIVEAYSLSAEEHKRLNFVDTTPDDRPSFVGDIHESDWKDDWVVKIPGVDGPHKGWTSLGGDGPMTEVSILESGPLRGHVRLSRQGESWDFQWNAGSSVLLWKASRGFRFATIAALPFLPFDRFVGGSEYEWPTGPGENEPPDHHIGVRPWKQLPGGHAVYYRSKENYGAFGLIALDAELQWTGIGSHKVVAEKKSGPTEIGLLFPSWKDGSTVLESRRENRTYRQPLLLRIAPGREEASKAYSAIHSAPREDRTELRSSGPLPEPFHPARLSLDGEWDLAWTEKGSGPPKEGWRKVTVPGNVQTQWLDPAKIYSKEAEWTSYKEWWYRKSIALPGTFSGKKVLIHFGATDYYADIYWNGKYLARHEGYMDPYRIDLGERNLTGGNNELMVRVWAPVNYYWKHRSYTVKGAYGGVDQKPDDITPMGISRSVYLQAYEGPRIADVAVDTRLVGEKDAEVEIQLTADSLEADMSYFWEVSLSPRNFSSSERYQAKKAVRAGLNRLVIPVANPQLWWTRDHGKPNLYNMEIRLVAESGRVYDGQSMAVGIREIEKIGWYFYLNRKRLFIRGTNYYYNLYISQMNREAYRKDIELMAGMNINLIRIHCHFSNPEFYDLADEMGILLWQDYLESWYPHDRRFSLKAARLYDPLIRAVRNHPSVAIWITSDEEDFENYRDLTKHLEPRPSLLDPQRRPVQRSTGRFGDSHIYYGWYWGTVWDYTRIDSDFVSELGATSLPNYETLVKYMPNAWPIRDHQEEWIFRRLQIKEAMKAWGDPRDRSLQEYIPITQSYVSRLFQIALERQRRLKYNHAGGICHFHAIDIWPSVTMAAIDFDRKPTKTYYTVQRSFAPVMASLEYDRDQWSVGESFRCGLWAINDLWDAIPNTRIVWKIVDSSGKAVHEGTYRLDMAADSVKKLGDISWPAAAPGAYELRAEVIDGAGGKRSENLFEFKIVARSGEKQ